MKILFPATNRVHLSRQQKLLDKLSEEFEVGIWTPETKQGKSLVSYFITCAVEFNNFLGQSDFDAVIIRGDRLEMAGLATTCAYREIPIIHIEGGAESGERVIDTKIRDAITSLADVHLVTDEEAWKRVVYLGAKPSTVFNVGSIDVSFAKSVKPKRLIEGDYIVLLHHALDGEETQTVYDAVEGLGTVVGVKSNSDYQQSLMNQEYSAEDFISLLYYAKAFVGNSSAACKESSILGVPTVLTGRRQDKRVVGHNVLRVPHDKEKITQAVKEQIAHGRYEPDEVYYKPDTEEQIVNVLKSL